MIWRLAVFGDYDVLMPVFANLLMPQLFGIPVAVLALPLFTLAIICGLWVASFFPRAKMLRLKGMELARTGRPAEAERCFCKALARGAKVPPADQVRLLVCLGDALMDQGRYPEPEHCLSTAMELGDPTGSCQSSIAQLLLLQGSDPQKALDMVEKGMELSFSGPQGNYSHDWGERIGNLARSGFWAQKAWALALLGRQRDAHEAVERALQLLESAQTGSPDSKTAPMFGPDLLSAMRLGACETEWRTGMALLALREADQAAVHFGIAYDTDRKNKYGVLARQQLKQLSELT
jgi:tetratricopeptide (TPR) repeat protein